MRDFLPEFGSMAIGGKYRPLYRLFDGDEWRQVFRNRSPVTCDTASEAIRVAKDRVKEILNSRIRVEHCDEVEADILGVEEWRKRKEVSAASEKEQVFGNKPAEIVFARKSKPVKVERKRRRRA